MLITLFIFGFSLEYMGVTSGAYSYPLENEIAIGVIPLSVTLAWVGLIYSAMIIGERLQLNLGLRMLFTTFKAHPLRW